MSKLVILRDKNDKSIDAVLVVENHDENFQKAFWDAASAWSESEEEFFGFIRKALTDAGYKFVAVDYETADA